MEGTSRASNVKRGRSQRRRASYIEIEYSGPSYVDLPKDILVQIFLKLSVMSIFVCKSVCRTWYDILSDHSFAKLHFRQVGVCPLLRSCGTTFRSRLLYLVEPNQGDFEQILDTKLKLPVRNLEKILIDGEDMLSICNPESGGGRLKRKDHTYGIVNSCNGLLCLCDPTVNNATMVCNLITGEFVDLPESEIELFKRIDCGFGYSLKSGQYKVIRMFTLFDPQGNGFDPIAVTEVNVLGTNTWKQIGSYPLTMYKKFPTYYMGHIFWLAFKSIIVFCVEEERFKLILLPPLTSLIQNRCDSMGVLGRDLYITDQYDDTICIWVKKDFLRRGTSWSKMFSTNLFNGVGKWPRGVYQPLKYLNNGVILMFHYPSNALIYKDPKKPGYKYLKVRGVAAKMEAIPHVPSLISLKDILSGSNMPVLNVKSRCAGLNLHDEKKVVSLVEEEFRDQ